jgi:hypothetical protein
MPNFNLGEMMSFVTTDCGRRGEIEQSVVSQRVNIAYMMVASATEPAMQERIAISSTTSGENRIDLPTDFGEMVNLSMKWSWSTSSSAVSSNTTLNRISLSDYDAQGALPVGEPRSYAFYSNWLELYPSPDSAYSLQIRYRSMVTDLVATTDVPSIATPYRWAVVQKAKQLVFDYLGDHNASAMMEQQYLNYMSQTKSDEYRRQMGESPQGLRPVYSKPSWRGSYRSS